MIVVDIGCAPRPRDDGTIEESIYRLLDRFQPSAFYGFDPDPVGFPWDPTPRPDYLEHFSIRNGAAWTYDGFIGYQEQGITSYVGEAVGPAAVPCFDLAAFLEDLPSGELVVKLDCEGAEYELIPHLIERGATDWIDLLLVEWHHEPLDLPFGCPVEVWS